MTTPSKPKKARAKAAGEQIGDKRAREYLDAMVRDGNFGCWRTLPEGKNWCSKTRNEMTVAERQAHQARITAMKVQREAEEKAHHAKARKECERIWADSSYEPCPDNHPYVIAKGIIPYGANVATEGYQKIIVPVYIEGEIWSVQNTPSGLFHWCVEGKSSSYKKRHN